MCMCVHTRWCEIVVHVCYGMGKVCVRWCMCVGVGDGCHKAFITDAPYSSLPSCTAEDVTQQRHGSKIACVLLQLINILKTYPEDSLCLVSGRTSSARHAWPCPRTSSTASWTGR